MITADQLKDVMDRADALHHYLNIDQKKVEFEEEQLRTQAPDFWEDPKYAQEQMKKVKGIQKWLENNTIFSSLRFRTTGQRFFIRIVAVNAQGQQF